MKHQKWDMVLPWSQHFLTIPTSVWHPLVIYLRLPLSITAPCHISDSPRPSTPERKLAEVDQVNGMAKWDQFAWQKWLFSRNSTWRPLHPWKVGPLVRVYMMLIISFFKTDQIKPHFYWSLNHIYLSCSVIHCKLGLIVSILK